MNPAANGECGPWNNLQWGSLGADHACQPGRARRVGRTGAATGSSGIGVQQQLFPQVALDVSYNRRWWSNFFVTHNAALTAADFDEVTMTAPQHPRAAERRRIPVSFLVRNDRNTTVGVNDPYYTTQPGLRRRDALLAWRGRVAERSSRAPFSCRRGTSTGRGVNDTCDVVIGRFGRPMTPKHDRHAGDRRRGRYRRPTRCDFAEPWLTQLRGLATYTVPKVDVLVSAIFRSQPNAQPAATTVATNGGSRNANYQMNAGPVPGGHRRAAAAGRAQETVNLLAPGDALWRARQRVRHAVRQGAAVRTHANECRHGSLQHVQREHADHLRGGLRSGHQWRELVQPTAVLTPRAARFNVQFDF